MPRVLNPQSVWDAPALLSAFQEAGIKPINAARLWGHLTRHPTASWADVPDFPKAALALLDARFAKFTSKVLSVQRSTDGETTKLLIQLQDGMQIESVIMTYDSSLRAGGLQQAAAEAADDGASEAGSSAPKGGGKRATLCVSSQVGCQMGCTFCATGTMGLKGNLSAGEIVEQLAHAMAVTQVRNIVFMGMGEPLNNYDAVKAAVNLMTDSRAFGLCRRHITVSTVGVIPRIKQLAADLPGVSLALSLHAPNQEVRQSIVPSAKAFRLDKLMEAVEGYQAASGQRVFVEYVVLAGVNDGLELAHQLGALLAGRNVVLNLIPWNPIYSPDGPPFAAPALERVQEFHRIIRTQYGVPCTVRQEKGQDISGACGQLVIDHSLKQQGCGGGDKGNGSIGGSVRDIEELVSAARIPAS